MKRFHIVTIIVLCLLIITAGLVAWRLSRGEDMESQTQRSTLQDTAYIDVSEEEIRDRFREYQNEGLIPKLSEDEEQQLVETMTEFLRLEKAYNRGEVNEEQAIEKLHELDALLLEITGKPLAAYLGLN